MTIGERIRQRRIELGLSQEELASRLGYAHKSSINKIELGLRNLTQSKIIAIADALETTPLYIMGWEDEETEEKPKDKAEERMAEYYNLISQLDEDDQKDVMNYINFLLSKKK